MKLMLALALAAALAGCTESIIMRDPKSGQTYDCGSHYGLGFYAFSADLKAQNCVHDYQARGWERVPE